MGGGNSGHGDVCVGGGHGGGVFMVICVWVVMIVVMVTLGLSYHLG